MALLLAATPLAPLVLLAALAVPGLRARALGLRWAAPHRLRSPARCSRRDRSPSSCIPACG